MDFNNDKIFINTSQIISDMQDISLSNFMNNYDNSHLVSNYVNENELNDSSFLAVQNNHPNQELINSNHSQIQHFQQIHYQSPDQINTSKLFLPNNSEINHNYNYYIKQNDSSIIFSNSINDVCAKNDKTEKFNLNVQSEKSSLLVKTKVINRIPYDNIIHNPLINDNNVITENVSINLNMNNNLFKIKNVSNIDNSLFKDEKKLNVDKLQNNQFIESHFYLNESNCSLVNKSKNLDELAEMDSLQTSCFENLNELTMLQNSNLNNSQCSEFHNQNSEYKRDLISIDKKKNDEHLNFENSHIQSNPIVRKAQKKTIIIFKVIDKIILDGKVVQETVVSNQEIEKETGTVDWIDDSKNLKLNKVKKVIKKNNLKRSVKDLNNNTLIKNSKKIILNKKSKIENIKIFSDDNISTICENEEQKVCLNDDLPQSSLKINIQNSPIYSILNFEFEEPNFKKIKLKEKVLAKWTDKNFYPGVVVKKESDNRWKIEFDDGGCRSVRESEIISIDYLPNGQSVMVNYLDGYCAKGTIKSHKIDKASNRIYYLIEYIVGVKCMETEYSSKDVFLTWEHAVSLLSKRKKNLNEFKFADVDLNNIIPKRSRVTNKSVASNNLNYSTSLEDTSEELDDSASISNLSSSSSTYSTNSNTTSKKKSKASKKKVKSNIKSNQLNELKNIKNNLNFSQKSVKNSIILEVKEERLLNDNKINSDGNLHEYDQLLGPIPKNPKLFENVALVLCSPFEDTVVSKNNTGTEVYAGYSVPFDFEYLTKQIKNGSGLILNTIDEAANYSSVILIANSYLRTIKYMQCLASGILCIMHTWIIDSCKKNILLKKEDYLLPSGFSIITNSLQTDRNIYKRNQSLFKGVKIYLISMNPELTVKWLPLFNSTKAILLDSLPPFIGTATRKPTNCADLIVTDSTCPESIMKKAVLLKIPIVSLEYVIQCLIHGKKLSIDAHSKFRHDYFS